MKLLLKLLAPWIAVGLCWCVFKNGWLAILTYHAQILLCQKEHLKVGRSNVKSHDFKTLDLRTFDIFSALPCAAAGPLVWVLLPHITHTELGTWLTEYHLTGWKLFLMVPYFGIIHPMLEQLHWAPLREQSRAAHFLFAGYHMLVLFSLVKTPWLIFCFAALTAASIAWQWMTQKSGSITAAILSHILADLGMILVAVVIRQ